MNQFKYTAFISYSHADEKWARWLHNALESYRLPARLMKAQGLTRARLTPVFRDRDELASSGDLSATIVDALKQSENLIVICSPNAKASRWVNAEVEQFLQLRDAARVFCLLIDSPVDSFPPALTADSVEPLAADARAQADGKNGAKLKLIAGMLEIGLDELKQREAARRYRRLAWVAAGSLGGMTLAVVLSLLAFQARSAAEKEAARAQAAETRAVRESEIANQITQFLVSLFESSDPRVAKGQDITAREVLDGSKLRIDSAFVDEPEIRARLLETIGRVYESLGVYDEAGAAFETALELRRANADNEPISFASALIDLGWLNLWIGKLERSETHFREALLILESELTPPDIDIAMAMNYVGVVLYRRQALNDAQHYLEGALAMVEASADADEQDRLAVAGNLANLLAAQGRGAEAEPLYREILANNRREYGEIAVDTAFAHDNLALALHDVGKLDEAHLHYVEAVRILELVYEPNHPELGQTYHNIATILYERGDMERAEDYARRSIEIHRKEVGEGYFMLGDSLVILAEVLVSAAQIEAAEAAALEALAVYQKTFTDDRENVIWSKAVLGTVRVAQSRKSEGLRLLEPAKAFYANRGPTRRSRKLAEFFATTGAL